MVWNASCELCEFVLKEAIEGDVDPAEAVDIDSRTAGGLIAVGLTDVE